MDEIVVGEEPFIAFIVFRGGHGGLYYEWGGICNEVTGEPTVYAGISILFHKVVRRAIICLLILFLICNSSVTYSSLISGIGSGVQNFALQISLKSLLKFEYMIDK